MRPALSLVVTKKLGLLVIYVVLLQNLVVLYHTICEYVGGHKNLGALGPRWEQGTVGSVADPLVTCPSLCARVTVCQTVWV